MVLPRELDDERDAVLDDDRAARGIVNAIVISVLGFWLPLGGALGAWWWLSK